MGVADGHDVVIVGSGAGGSATAYRLCQAGLKVLLLEAGPAFRASEDYPLDNPGWERQRFPVKPNSQTVISYGDLGHLDPEFDHLASWSRGGFPWRPTVGSRRKASGSGYSYVMGLGGSTLHYVGEAHRLHPDAFRMQSLTGRGTDWPISYEDLEPYYQIAEEVVGVAGETDRDGRWRSAPFPLPPHPLSPGAASVMAAASRLGQQWSVNPRAALSQPYQNRPACNYCGQCSRGCPLGDKGSADVTFLAAARETGRLTVVTEATVTGLNASLQGTVSSLDYIKDGLKVTIETPELVLACGAVQTPRLLMISADSENPEGLANGSKMVGRNFMETLHWHSAGFMPELRNSHKGLPADAIWWGASAPSAPSAPSATSDRAGGFRLSHSTLEIGLNGPIGYATRLVDGFGTEFKAKMRADFGSALAISGIGQVIPDERSRITLDPQQNDRFGLPAARINSVLTTESLSLLSDMAAATRQLMAECDVDTCEEISSWDRFGSTHVFGTACMGQESGKSVVDSYGRSHDYRNLWIADASVFPTSGGGEAPALTIMSFALRLSDRLVSR